MIIPSVTATVKESRDIMKINPAAAHGIYRTNLAGYKSALSAQDPQTSAESFPETQIIFRSASLARASLRRRK